jgi:uncharacterized membrane protein
MDAFTHFLEQVAVYIDIVGIGIVLYGFAIAMFGFVRAELARFKASPGQHTLQMVRIELGGYILTGIEFMIASDIVHTVLSRELMDLAFVSALVVIRTAISFFLGREVAELKR